LVLAGQSIYRLSYTTPNYISRAAVIGSDHP
jgi:hypothetical protein